MWTCRYFSLLENVKHLLSLEMRDIWKYIGFSLRPSKQKANVNNEIMCQEFIRRGFIIKWCVINGQMAGMHAIF